MTIATRNIFDSNYKMLYKARMSIIYDRLDLGFNDQPSKNKYRGMHQFWGIKSLASHRNAETVGVEAAGCSVKRRKRILENPDMQFYSSSGRSAFRLR